MKESETIEFMKSIAELNYALKSISAILNKHQKGEVYFGLKMTDAKVPQSKRGLSEGVLEGLNPILVPLYLFVKKNPGSRTKQFVAAINKPQKNC